VSIAISAEQLAIQASIRKWASATDPVATVRALEPDAAPAEAATMRAPEPGGSPAEAATVHALKSDASPAETATVRALPEASPAEAATARHRAEQHWADLAGLGVFAIAVSEHLGGAGGDALDLAAALEEITAALVPGPILPTLLAELVLAGQAARPAAEGLLPELAAGSASVAVALDAGTLTTTRLPGGALRVRGRLGPLLGAGAATHLLLAANCPAPTHRHRDHAEPTGDTWFLIPADHPGVRLARRSPVDFSRTLAEVELTDAVVAPDAVLADGLRERVRDIAAMLGAVEAAAVAGWCLRTATEYAKVRRQFGRPIGSFQAIKHLCAAMLCRAERCTAVAWDAARALSTAPAEAPLAASAAAAIALDAAVDNAKDCIQVLGGIGFTWEHDAHLYLRRALALRQLLGGGTVWRQRSAALTLGGARRSLRIPAPTEVGDAVRARVDQIAALPEDRRRAALAEAGYLTPEWPLPYGLDAGPAEQLTIDQELARAGILRPDLAIAGWAVPTILRHGTAAQRERFTGPSLRGEITWCQLFSEPDAGSDLAALRTRAQRVAGGWRLTGQKVWTSLAGRADWGICLARTDPAAAKHRGLTYFLVAMRDPGITVRPLREITGRAMFNEVFLDDVFVPDDCVVGEPGDGWRLARGTLEFERVAMGRGSSLGEGVEELVTAVHGSPRSTDPIVLDQLGALIADGLTVSLLDLRSVLRRLHGNPAATESAVAKLVGVSHRQAVAEASLVLSGPGGATAGTAAQEFLLTRCLSIAGGTTQILLTVVAERVLGLPREG
jgi:alkylation response protein AidB-like acyl-CoA dehydrogenase